MKLYKFIWPPSINWIKNMLNNIVLRVYFFLTCLKRFVSCYHHYTSLYFNVNAFIFKEIPKYGRKSQLLTISDFLLALVNSFFVTILTRLTYFLNKQFLIVEYFLPMSPFSKIYSLVDNRTYIWTTSYDWFRTITQK